MKILVTGGAGFIGSTIVDLYVSQGHEVWVIDDESSGRKKNVNPKAHYFRLDVRDRKGVERFFKKHKFQLVNHHAAQIDVRKSVADPILDANVNIVGLLNILEQCRLHKVRKIIFSSSGGTVYGECKRPADESFPEVPLSPYGVAKLSSEKYIQTFASLYGLKFTIFRYANVFGPRQDPHGEAGVVAIFSERLLEGKQSLIFGNGRQTRDFVYVRDVARANIMALKKADNQILNIGTGRETSVLQLFQTMSGLVGGKASPKFKKARAGELARSVLAISKARRVLGWKPAYSLQDGLRETMQYFSRELRIKSS